VTDREPSIRPIALSPSTWRAAHDVAAAVASTKSDAREGATALLRALAADGILAPGASSLRHAPRFAALWQGLGPLIDAVELTATLDQLGETSGLSRRTLIRTLQSFIPTFGIVGESWRDATHRLRLKCALLLLSAEEVSVAEVATATGYASPEALGRAFREGGLEPPSHIRQRLRALVQALD
jgi:transcriptional regulator GlxA family with amidase domain